jgi:hypothetical protein
VKFAPRVWPAAVALCSSVVCSAPVWAQSQLEAPPAEATLDTSPGLSPLAQAKFEEPQARQPVLSLSHPSRETSQIRIAASVWASGVLADQITTYQFSSQYRDLLREMNPLIRGLDRHPTLLVAAGSAMDAATGWAAYRFLAPNHPRIAKVAFYGFAAYRMYLAAYNIRMMERADTVRASLPR